MQELTFIPYVQSLLTIAGIYLIAMISPGPDFAMILRNSLVFSKRSGLMAALGITMGIMMHATYTMFGLGLIIKNSEMLFKLIQASGAAYLIYIGWQSLKTKAAVQKDAENFSQHAPQDLTPFQAFKTGFLSNALNPMVIIFFVSVFSSMLPPNTPMSVQCFCIVEMASLTLTWFSCVALFFSAPTIRQHFLKLGHWLERLAGGVLISLGIRIVLLLGRG